ncbi:uncharacterized protein [Chiloscyllium punctatum]|uniref:uncharacterized protein n=1 Tax=Chiloscyllium punctatum TaxID=137246 RepID=UPI003B63E5C9
MSIVSVFPVDAVTLVLLGALTIILLLYFNSGLKNPGVINFPPGPPSLPVIGNLHMLDLKKLNKSLMNLSEKYGEVISIKLGPTTAVVLTGYEAVKDALVNNADEFGERAHIPIFEAVSKGHGITFGHGESWKQMRRFALTTLRDFGMGKKTIEDKIIEELDFLVKIIEAYKGQPFNPTIQLNSAVANIICSIVFGDRFDYEDEKFVSLVKRVNENIQLVGSPVAYLYNAFPLLRFLPGSHNKVFTNTEQTMNFLKGFFKENRQKLDDNDLRSFIDVFMIRQQKGSVNHNSYFHEDNLLTSTNNLFAAGMETTSTTLRWGMLLMMKYPEIQKKVHEEIIRVIGSERHPRVEDRKDMPYTDAVIHEIQRFGDIVPLGLTHETTVDVNFRGYFIPKGTHVIPLLSSVLFDKTQWEKPNEFNPSHFLNAEGKFVKRDAFMPFSAGRRICAGETLAKMELFLFFTTLIQKFKFHVPPNVSELELESGVGFTSFPKYQTVCATAAPPVASFDPGMSIVSVFPVDAVTLVLLGALTIILLLYFNSGLKNPGVINFPPGPPSLPVIGNLHMLDLKKLNKSLMKLSEKYGEVFSIKLGPTTAVVLTGYEAVKDALVNNADEFGERAHIPIFEAVSKGHGIIFGHGESWKQMRRFALSTLRDFGMGKKTIEDKIIEESDFLVKMIDAYQGQPFNPTIQLNSAVANIICSIVFGDRFDYEDEKFVSLIKRVNENIQLVGSPVAHLYNAFPLLRFLPGRHNKVFTNTEQTINFLKGFFKENRHKLDGNDLRSFIDVFMIRQQKESDNPNSYFHEDNLLTSTNNLFAAGMETTSTTLRWGMLLMMKYPEIQKKVHEEIIRVIGSERHPRVEDRKDMPYTDAVIHEIQRFGDIVPLGITHETTVDVNFRGNFIPKGTHVIPLLSSVLYDKTQWEKPNEFNPSHFLNAEGKFVKRDAFMPFSAGRRICAGETLAKMELFLFFTTLIQKFKFHVPPNVSELELESGVGFTSFPKYQTVCAVRR